MKRALSSLLLALHLVVFVLGGALAFEPRAHAAGHHNDGTAVITGGLRDGAFVSSSSDARIDRATRARGDRRDRGSGAPPLDAFVPHTAIAIAPASGSPASDLRSPEREHSRVPSLVNAPRGPPQAR